MSTGTRVSLRQAAFAAETLVDRLRPVCERIEVAGSIRRGREDVGDIEILAVPRVTTEPDGLALMGDVVESNLLARRIHEMIDEGYLRPPATIPADGERYIKVVDRVSGLQVDIFMVRPPATWGVLLLIRTGPAEFSQWVVTEARRRGFHVVDGALHRGSLACAAVPCEIIPTPEESDFFGALGLGWRPPHMRDGAFFR